MPERAPVRSIKDWRRLRFMTQKELAAAMGISNNAVSNWEKNVKQISPHNLKKLCEVLRVDAEQITLPTGEGKENPVAAA